MRVIKSISGSFKPERPQSMALGTFDGVHLGHQQVIMAMLAEAKAMDYDASVFTFSNLPRHYQGHQVAEDRILCLEDKIELFEAIGVDNLWVVPFNEHVQGLAKEDFLGFLLDQLNVRHITVGYNFRFGKGGEGTAQWLLAQQDARDFSCHVVGAIEDGSGAISSTRIREHLRSGDIHLANRLLGRTHYVSGVVHPGKQLGRTIGYPTANLKISPNMTLLKSGVYVTETSVAGVRYASVTNVGFNPTFDQEEFNLETYILDFNESLYHQRIKVYFHHRIRDELKFSGVEELKEWIGRDVEETKRYFAQHEHGKHIYKTIDL